MSPRSPFRSQRPGPSRAWIRYVPRRWPGPEGPWVDLSRGRLGSSNGDGDDLEALAAPELDDTVYLPPVRPELRAVRDRVAAAHRERGTPVLVQVLPGEPGPSVPCLVVLDLLPMAARGEVPETLESPGLAANVSWPLLPGGPERPDLPDGVVHALAVAVDLEPRETRALAELRPSFEASDWALFHRAPPAAEDVLRHLRERGIQPYLPRPLPDPPWPGRTNRFLAAGLALVGELGHHLGVPASRSESFLRAARFVDESPHDLGDLARDGNLDVLPWLEEEPRDLVERLLDGGEAVPSWEIWEWVSESR